MVEEKSAVTRFGFLRRRNLFLGLVPGTSPFSPVSFFASFLFFLRMAAIESEAYFDSRMATMGISGGVIVKIKAKGWSCLADFAYASAYIPGQGNEAAFVTSVLEAVVGQAYEDSPDTPKLRRLYFEAHTLSVADLRRRTERTDSDPPIKLPAEERVVRMARLKNRLNGFDISGVNEPSHSLVDSITQMLETSQIRYVAWSTCTARDQEILGIKKIVMEPGFEPDASGFLKQKTKPDEYLADITTDLLLTHALFRRAIAFELANVCRFEVFAALTTKLLKEYMRPSAHKYAKVSLEQLENADKHVFIEIGARTVGGVGVRPDGTIPVEVAMRDILNSPEFLFLLMQMPATSGGNSSSGSKQVSSKGSGKNRGTSRSRSRRRKVTEMQDRNRKANATARASSSSGKGQKTKGGKASKGRSKGPFDPSTEVGRTVDGAPICFAFNTGGCTECSPGERCSKGFHVCWKIGCGQSSSSHSHV